MEGHFKNRSIKYLSEMKFHLPTAVEWRQKFYISHAISFLSLVNNTMRNHIVPSIFGIFYSPLLSTTSVGHKWEESSIHVRLYTILIWYDSSYLNTYYLITREVSPSEWEKDIFIVTQQKDVSKKCMMRIKGSIAAAVV